MDFSGDYWIKRVCLHAPLSELVFEPARLCQQSGFSSKLSSNHRRPDACIFQFDFLRNFFSDLVNFHCVWITSPPPMSEHLSKARRGW